MPRVQVTSARQARRAAASGARNEPTVRQANVQLSDRQVKGFQKNAQRIAKQQGMPYDRAAAILAASSRGASAAAKRKNPALKRVKGKAGK